MVRISEDMVRRRAEHNNSEIFSLEELSLHQQNIEKLENLDKWCRHLKTLYLQNNLISRIENVNRLKKLEYLNLALNNIEVIENLEGCESLQKLDLTVNFVAQLSSVESLKENQHLKELFLVGNPCSQYEGYRQYVVATLPQLQFLDGTAIGRLEHIRAGQGLEELRKRILEQEEEQLQKRERQKMETKISLEDNERQSDDNSGKDHQEADLEQEKEFWEKPCSFTPESRLEAHRQLEKGRSDKKRNGGEQNKTFKKPKTLITADGKVLNVNEARMDFVLTEDENNSSIQLDLHLYRYMDTSLMDVDVQPTYVRVTVKGKVFQLVLPSEVKPDSSTAQRSQTTGHLLINMPLVHGEEPKKMSQWKPPFSTMKQQDEEKNSNMREYLEVDPSKRSLMDLYNIVSTQHSSAPGPRPCSADAPPISQDWMDDLEVPPLI
ncbi:dynein axonemal assembly factor 11 [Denticeps clupeoides]|uniref:dynein axonemal assembly factor 11 n=1 Tax=Denticeps clupeoides TaxID=299321 RepID=UPI0010A3CF55|nr:protein tilB homolog [Denticeps clupeoides]